MALIQVFLAELLWCVLQTACWGGITALLSAPSRDLVKLSSCCSVTVVNNMERVNVKLLILLKNEAIVGHACIMYGKVRKQTGFNLSS